MAYMSVSSDFDLDDDGILRDSTNAAISTESSDAGFQLDDNGILRDEFDPYNKIGGHWTDSGFGGDRQSSQSTLLQTNNSFNESFHDDDRSINISELEASKDDIDTDRGSFSGSLDREWNFGVRHSFESPRRLKAEYSKENRDPTKSNSNKSDIFTEEYYQGLRDLGVLVDSADFDDNQNNSLLNSREFDQHYFQESLYDSERDIRTTQSISHEEHVGRNIAEDARRLPETRSSSTISSQSFPEITPEEAEELYENKTYKYVDKKSAFDFFPTNSKDDDDEIFFITSRIPSSKINNRTPHSISPNQSSTSTRPASSTSHRSSRPQTPYSRELLQHNNSAYNEEGDTSLNREDLQIEIPTRPETASPPGSHRSLSSESGNHTSRSGTGKKLPKAVSQESFFEKPKSERMPKRMLPKPNTSEDGEYKIQSKSKSTTNIYGRSGPVKPTHMTISEITRITMDDTEDGNKDGSKPKGEHVELSTKLKQEFVKRKQATVLVQQLQKDYDSLLSKYALAELTIDQMRLGAKINLHTDSPIPNQIPMGSLAVPQSIQSINLGGIPGRAALSSSPAINTRYLSPSLDVSDAFNSSSLANDNNKSASTTDKVLGRDSDDRMLKTPSGADQVKASLLVQTKLLDQRIQSFENLVENKQLSLEDKEQVFDKIRTDHEKLRRQYLQSKEDYNVMRRSGATTATEANFDDDKELEGELFKLGMKFDEMHEQIDSHLQEGKEQRQPFQSQRLADEVDGEDGNHSDVSETAHAVDQLKKQMHDPNAGNDMIHPKLEPEFEGKLRRLHDEYNALMDRYRRLKQMAKTPDRDKEIDNLVRKLKVICDEAPQIFHLPPELEERMERLNKKDQEAKNRVKSQNTAAELVNGQLHGVNGEDVGMIESSNLNFNSAARFPPGSGRYNGDQGQVPSPRQRLSPRNGPGLPRSGRDRHSDRDSNSSHSPRDSGAGRVQRPTRHDHDFQDRKLKKNGVGGGSRTSLPDDSGISDQEEGATALSKLPGPGKFKQMTKQQGADDVDSGFVGSVVGPGQQQQQQQQEPQQETLRLRQPTDNQERPSSRQSAQQQPGARNKNLQTNRPASSHGSRRSSSDRFLYDESGDASDLYEEDSELSDVSMHAQRGNKQKHTQKQHSSTVVETEDEDTDVTPRPKQQLKSKPEQRQQQTEIRNQEKHRSTKLPRTRDSYSSGETTPRATPPKQGVIYARHSIDNMEREMLPQQFSPQKIRTDSRQTSQQKVNSSNAMKTQRENARGFRNLTTLGVQSSREVAGTESDTTRGSSTRSSRLQALQDQLDRLRETVAMVHENRIPPPPAPQNREEPEYYDPFDDPYGFMRMPRRRANSFSGRGGRDFDDYWTLPVRGQQDDLPLGYAAADAYAENAPPSPNNPVRTRIHKRNMDRARRHSEEEVQVPLVRNSYGSDPSLNIPSAHTPMNPELFHRNHEQSRLPQHVQSPSRYSTTGMRLQLQSQGYFRTPSGAKIYMSQKPHNVHSGARPREPQSDFAGIPYSAEFLRTHQRNERPHVVMHNGYVSENSYRPRVNSLPHSRRPVASTPRHHSQRVRDVTREQYYSDINVESRSRRRPPPYPTETSVCVMCGGTGEHTHSPESQEHILRNSYRHTSRTRRRSASRTRSRSVPRHSSPRQNRIRSEYYNRDISDLSDTDSEEEILTPRQRSQSFTTSRKYRSKSRHREYSDEESNTSDESTDLNESLRLSGEIKKLTKKMKKEVVGEIRKHGLRRRKDFGSSDW